MEGKIKHFDSDGFCHILPKDGSEYVFIHISKVGQELLGKWALEQNVAFEITTANNYREAIDLREAEVNKNDAYYDYKITFFCIIQAMGIITALGFYYVGLYLDDPYTAALSQKAALSFFSFVVVASILGILFVAPYWNRIRNKWNRLNTGVDDAFTAMIVAKDDHIPRAPLLNAITSTLKKDLNGIVTICAIVNIIAIATNIFFTGGSQNSIFSPYLFAVISMMIIIDETRWWVMILFSIVVIVIYVVDAFIPSPILSNTYAQWHGMLLVFTTIVCFLFSISFAVLQRNHHQKKLS